MTRVWLSSAALAVTLAVFWYLEWLTMLSVVLTTLVLLAVLFFGEHASWLVALLPLAIPFGFVATIPVGRFWLYDITFAEIVLLITAFVSIYVFLWGHVRLAAASKIEFWIVGFFVVAVLSKLWADDIAKYLIALRMYSYHLLAFFFGAFLVTKRFELTRALRSMTVLLAILSVELIVAVVQLGSIKKLLIERDQITTPVGALAFVAALIVLLLPMVYAQTRWSKGAWSKFATAATIGGIIAVVISLGKAALLTTLIVWGFFSWKQKALKSYVKFLIALALVVVVLQAVGVPTFEQWTYRLSTIVTDPSNNQRITEIVEGWRAFLSSPFVGVGAGNVKVWYGRHATGIVAESNNIFIQLLAEGGIIGMVFVIGITTSLWKMLKRMAEGTKTERDQWIALGFQGVALAAVVHGMLEVTLVGLLYGVLFWLMVGVGVSYERMGK